MKDWKQEIAEAIRARCDTPSGSALVGVGCPECQALFVDIMWIMNSALAELAVDIDSCVGFPSQMIDNFRRSIPTG